MNRPQANTTPRALVTGSARGLGFETASQLARQGIHVIISDINRDGGEAAVATITSAGGSAEFFELDLSDLSKIRRFAEEQNQRGLPLDILVNNAGILPPFERAISADGYELEFAIAHLGHFALTGLLLPSLLRSENPRVVSISSISHPGGNINFDDLQAEQDYLAIDVYASTKLACLLFSQELHRRSVAANSKLLSVAAHPGVSRTAIAADWDQHNKPKLIERLARVVNRIVMKLFGQTPEQGANSFVLAATGADIEGGGYYGPTGVGQMNGKPGKVKPHKKALDTAVAARLWDVSEQLTGVSYRDMM
jgi:NAD(P)-dependent dehydrogenase (short-subunit alcohol dehydrogenase family)